MKDLVKPLLPFIVAALVAAGSFLTGAVTTLGDAVKIALDKEEAIKACEKLISE